MRPIIYRRDVGLNFSESGLGLWLLSHDCRHHRRIVQVGRPAFYGRIQPRSRCGGDLEVAVDSRRRLDYQGEVLGGVMANGIILKSKTVSPIECLRYALNLPTSVVITGVDSMEILDQACEVARTFHPLSDAELTALLSKTAKAAARGEFEPFKTSSIFDGTAQHPAWLGDEPRRLRDLMP